METPKKLPEHKYKEHEVEGFRHFDMPMFQALGATASYKLRLDISDEFYTDECKAEIVKIIKELNSKYDYNEKPTRYKRSPVIYGFKYNLENKKDVDKLFNLNKIILEYLNAVKQNNKGKSDVLQQYIQTHTPKWLAENIEKIANPKELESLITFQEKVIFSHYRLVDQGQFTLYLSYFNENITSITHKQ